jgi:hypothetical protein
MQDQEQEREHEEEQVQEPGQENGGVQGGSHGDAPGAQHAGPQGEPHGHSDAEQHQQAQGAQPAVSPQPLTSPLPSTSTVSKPAPMTDAQPLPQPLAPQLPQLANEPPPYPVRIHSRFKQQTTQQTEGGSAPQAQPVSPGQQAPSAWQPQSEAAQVFEVQPFQEPPVDKEQQYIEQQEKALTQPDTSAPPAKPCRHEYVRIFQRKLKDLNRRMVCTKAYLPVGFKMGDFGHLGENSFCFCATCRVRLYPKRSQAEKAEARIQLAQGKALKAEQSLLGADLIEEVGAKALAELLMRVDDDESAEPDEEEDDENVPKVDIHVEELEQEVVGVEDIDVESLKGNQEEDSCELLDREEM